MTAEGGVERISSSSGPEIEDRKFAIFPKLPIEIRFKIWKMALPGPRIVEILLDYTPIGPTDEQGNRNPKEVVTLRADDIWVFGVITSTKALTIKEQNRS
jgi:hypothetical protein